MAEVLTNQQKQAVNDRGGKLLVSAAAGSGKTKVLVDRLMSYLTDPVAPANIDDFLMITYTKAAAAELRGKIASKLSQRIAEEPENRHLQQQLQRLYLTKISTVHAFCGDILREYAYRLDLPGDFRVADENECAELRAAVAEKVLEQAYETAAENPRFCAFVDSQGLGRNDSRIPDILLKVYDSARCHLNPRQWMDKCLQMSIAEGTTDASETEYGTFLIHRLWEYLDLQIPAMESCAALAATMEGCEKASALLADTVFQLQALRECETWDQITKMKDLDYGTLSFPRKNIDQDLVDRIKAVRDNLKKGLAKQVRPFADQSAQVLSDLKSCSEAAKGLLELVEAFGQEYDRIKKSRRILDFSDLEHRMLDLLWGKSRSNLSAVAVEIGSRFREIMVDEYQDSNAVQDAIYRGLSEKKQNLFMVGDVKQSIYQFRLADPGIFLEKYAAYVPAGEAVAGQGRKVMLSQNFRSSGGVLEAANDVFRTCMCPQVGGLYYGEDEALHEGLKHTPLGSPEAELYCVDVREDAYEEEAAFVAEKIRQMLADGSPVRDGDALRPVRPEDIVILLRSPGSCGYHFQRALERIGIRCTSGGGVDLLKTEEIGALRSLLQAVHNPRLDIPLIGAMASPIFGFSADDLARIRSANRNCCFYDALCRHEDTKSQTFLKTLGQLRSAVRKENLTGLLEEIWFRTGMDDVYAAMENGDQRRENLQIFFRLASDFAAGDQGDLGRFLEYLDRMEEKGLNTTGQDGVTGAVSIMSIHKSKGLEFPVVFLCDLGRGFNMMDSQANVLCHKELGLGLSAVDNAKRIRYPSISKLAIAAQIRAEVISEELRVLYVAMTRPKDRLIMTYASGRLEKDLSELVLQLDVSGKEMLIREATCPGDWVLLTAIGRTEAGELFALGGYPKSITPGEPAWKIRVAQAPESVHAVREQAMDQSLPEELLDRIRAGLAFRYSHRAAVSAPSKQTATQRKGRVKDQEAAEHTDAAVIFEKRWRKPAFIQKDADGRDYGNAIHAVMQYIDYSACQDTVSVQREISRLVSERYITQDQAAMVDHEKIADFFRSEIGQKLRYGTSAIREFKFSILEDGEVYDEALKGEQVLLQGVVDCALLEEDGITVLDFKSDRVTEATVSSAAERYRTQVSAYAQALERIYGKKVKRSLLYFFRIGHFVDV